MSNQGSQIKSYLGISAIVSLYGIAGLIVLYAGPKLGIDLTYQIVIIALLLLTWPFALIISHYRKKKEEATAAPEPAAGNNVVARKGTTGAARIYDEIVRGAEEVVQWLKNTKLGASKGTEPVYSLPWFIVAGPPASGKTSLLLSAKLDFHALPSQRRAEQSLIRPTRDCEWRVTDAAVYLDTAGRYQTEGPDSDEWSSLIETLKKYRKTRPLDGFVVAISLPRIVSASEIEIEQISKTLRARLDEVILRTQIRFPVYLVFTGADAVAGFREFFLPFDEGERAQVWGATIPLEQSPNAHALFDIELDYLYDALMRCRLERLSLPAMPPEQLSVFDFPLRFAETRRKLGLFASAMFRPNPFSEKPLLRGFYFTSSGANQTASQQPQGAPLVASTGFFTEYLFKDVLHRDRELAASFQAATVNPNRYRTIGLIAASAMVLLLATALLISYFNNRELVARAEAAGKEVEKTVLMYAKTDISKRSLQESQIEFQNLDTLRNVISQLEEYERSSPPWMYRFGLYSGDSILPYLRAIYFDSLHQRFLKPSWEALQTDLQGFTSGAKTTTVPSAGAGNTPAEDLGIYYDKLKAYLMLSNNRDKTEAAFLIEQLTPYWKKNAPPELEKNALEHLSVYATLAGLEDAPQYINDPKITAESRQRLKSYPASNRIYKRTIGDISSKIRPVGVDTIVGKPNSSLKGSYLVPGSFTLAGYKKFEELIPSAAKEIKKYDWVMDVGDSGEKSQDQDIDEEALKNKLWTSYANDYTQQWRNFLHGLNVQECKTKQESIDMLRELAASDSPMKLVMEEVSRQTKLSKASSSGFWGWITSWFSTSNKTGGPMNVVEQEFEPLYKFTTAEGGKETPAISAYLSNLTDMRDGLGDPTKSVLTVKEGETLEKAENKVGNLLPTFVTVSASEAARALRQPLGRIRDMGNVGVFDQITKEWRDTLLPLATKIQSGFPFNGAGEASLTELTGYLNPQDGKFTKFYKEKLSGSFEEVGGQLKLKESGAFKLAPEFIKYLNDVKQIQDALFTNGSKEANFSGTITLDPSAGEAVIEIGNDRISTAQPSVKFNWPPKGGAAGARISSQGGGEPKQWVGEWGLFKMLSEGSGGSTAPQSDGQFQLNWRVGTTLVKAKLNTDKNPFQLLNLFKQIKVPERIKE